MSRWNQARTLDPPVFTAKAAGMTQSQTPPLALKDLTARCDPYLRWAVLSNWRGFERAGQWGEVDDNKALAEQAVRILVQADEPGGWQVLQKLGDGVAVVPPVYGKEVASGAGLSRHATVCLKVSELATLIHQYPELRWKLAAPLKDQSSGLPGTAKGYRGQQADFTPLPAVLDFSKVAGTGPPRPTGADTAGTIAVIDFGCPFLHNAVGDVDQTTSRLVALWDQGDVRLDDPWTKPLAMGYGGEMQGPHLRTAWQSSRHPGFVHDEARAYAGMQYLIDYEDPRRRTYPATHGAHVLDAAGGVRNAVNHKVDAASNANLVFVQLPYNTIGDSSGGSLSAHLLDALRYIFQVADEKAPEAPLVVNISYGSTAGPHDGSSLIEEAMDELLQHRPLHTAIVLAAGNSRNAGLHVRRRVYEQSSALFRIEVAAGDSTDTFVEFWYSAPAKGKLQFRARLPGGDWCPWLDPDEQVELTDSATQDRVAALIHQTKVPNGKRSMVLLALRPTEAPDGDDAVLAEPGMWEVEARLDDYSIKKSRQGEATAGSISIDAWVERDDPRPFSGRKQTRFVGLEPTDADNTLSSIATGQHTVVVGGFRCSDGALVDYSSTGPRFAGQWPMTYALCERDSLDQGLRAAAVRSGETLLMNGTSVAAPVMARELYKLMHAAWVADPKAPLDRAALFKRLKAVADVPDSVLRVGPKPVRKRPV